MPAAPPSVDQTKPVDIAPPPSMPSTQLQPKAAADSASTQVKTSLGDHETAQRRPSKTPTSRIASPAPELEPKADVPPASGAVVPTAADSQPAASSIAPTEPIQTPQVAADQVALVPLARPPVAAPSSEVKQPPAAAHAPARSPTGPSADDESLAASGDADALLRVAEQYAAGRSGFPNHLLAYTYFQLAFLSGKPEAAAKAREEKQRLQPPEIRPPVVRKKPN